MNKPRNPKGQFTKTGKGKSRRMRLSPEEVEIIEKHRDINELPIKNCKVCFFEDEGRCEWDLSPKGCEKFDDVGEPIFETKKGA